VTTAPKKIRIIFAKGIVCLGLFAKQTQKFTMLENKFGKPSLVKINVVLLIKLKVQVQFFTSFSQSIFSVVSKKLGT